MRPEGVLGLGPKARSKSDPVPTVEHMFKKNTFGSQGRNMFALSFGRYKQGIITSYIWFGGYSHAWLRTYIQNGAQLTNKEIDAMLACIDINREDKEWVVPIKEWSVFDA